MGLGVAGVMLPYFWELWELWSYGFGSGQHPSHIAPKWVKPCFRLIGCIINSQNVWELRECYFHFFGSRGSIAPIFLGVVGVVLL